MGGKGSAGEAFDRNRTQPLSPARLKLTTTGSDTFATVPFDPLNKRI